MLTNVAHLSMRSVRYLEAGKGKALVLLHAFPLSADQWLPQLHRVPPGWRYVAPDLRGFRGVGPAYEDLLDDVTIDTHAADVFELMTHLEIDQAVVAGLSMGGYVAFGMLRRAPQRVMGLVLSNTRANADTPEGQQARDRMLALVRTEGARGVAGAVLPQLLGRRSLETQPDLIDAVRRLIEVNSADGLAAAISALKARPDSTELLATIACPALVVSGEQDELIPRAESDALQAAIPNAAARVLPTGHLSNLEDPGGFTVALAEFGAELGFH